MRYSSIVEIENMESHPQRFLKTIVINDCNNSRLEKVKKLFEPEVEKIKSSLENQNINCAKIEDYYYEENLINIVYEYIEGRELTEKSWDEAKILDFLKKILPTLQKLHDNKIIHGNIKPSNFLEQNSNYFLLDFGFVTKIYELTFDEQNQVKNQPLQGTKGYRAKEVQEGFEAQPYSDIYSLGITIIELLTGKSPQKFKNQDDEIIWELVKEISPNFLAILKKMVESDYRDRYNNVAEILEQLDKYGNTTNRPEKNTFNFSQFPISFFKFFNKNKKVFFGLGLILLAVLGSAKYYVIPRMNANFTFEDIKKEVKEAQDNGTDNQEFYQNKLDKLNKEVLYFIPDSSKFLTYRGFLLGKLGEHKLALDSCQTAINLNDKFPNAWNCIGAEKYELGKIKQVQKLEKEAIQYFDEAMQNFNEAIRLRELQPQNNRSLSLEEVLTNKAKVFSSLGQEDNACQQLKEVERINKSFPVDPKLYNRNNCDNYN